VPGRLICCWQKNSTRIIREYCAIMVVGRRFARAKTAEFVAQIGLRNETQPANGVLNKKAAANSSGF